MCRRSVRHPGKAELGPGASLGFTFTDALVAIAVVSVLAALVVVPIVRSKQRSTEARCAANLKAIGRAILEFAGDRAGSLPASEPDQRHDLWFWYKEPVKRYAGLTGPSSAADAIFACPNDRGYSDPKPFHQSARFDYNSYPFNGVMWPGVPNIAGWRLPTIREPQRTLLVMEWTAHAPLSWHRSRTGQKNSPFYSDAESMVGFVDGHVKLVRIYYDGYNAAYTQDPISGYEYKYSGD
jgi:prepilin-type processing-associated H-X9-DG protein